MTQDEFRKSLEQHAPGIEAIRQAAYRLHQEVNQTYGEGLPYGHHLDMVADGVRRYGHSVCATLADVLPLFFGAYFHDSIEDARLTYNDVRRAAGQYMDGEQALVAAEAVYALTNDKGRTRAERAGENYYRGIRETPYAPLLKLADRLANIAYSSSHDNGHSVRMREVYRAELPHFLAALQGDTADRRLALPEAMVEAIRALVGTE